MNKLFAPPASVHTLTGLRYRTTPCGGTCSPFGSLVSGGRCGATVSGSVDIWSLTRQHCDAFLRGTHFSYFYIFYLKSMLPLNLSQCDFQAKLSSFIVRKTSCSGRKRKLIEIQELVKIL